MVEKGIDLWDIRKLSLDSMFATDLWHFELKLSISWPKRSPMSLSNGK